jgi:hypothetical protein
MLGNPWVTSGSSRTHLLGVIWLVSYIVKEIMYLHCALWPTPITVTARSKARTVFARSNTGFVCSSPTTGMDVWVCSVFVLSCISRALRRADPLSKEYCRLSIRLRNWIETKSFTDTVCSKGSNRKLWIMITVMRHWKPSKSDSQTKQDSYKISFDIVELRYFN